MHAYIRFLSLKKDIKKCYKYGLPMPFENEFKAWITLIRFLNVSLLKSEFLSYYYAIT